MYRNIVVVGSNAIGTATGTPSRRLRKPAVRESGCLRRTPARHVQCNGALRTHAHLINERLRKVAIMKRIAHCAPLLLACSVAACTAPEQDDIAETSQQLIIPTWDGWKTVAQGTVGTGVSVAATPIGSSIYTLFRADPLGGIYTIPGNPQQGWPGWTRVGNGLASPHGSVAAIPIGNGQSALFVVGTNGGVYNSMGSFQTSFTDWPGIPGLTARLGTTVPAIPTTNSQIRVFAVGEDGGIYTNVGRDQSWDPMGWRRVGSRTARQGTTITALPVPIGLFALFIIGTNGMIYPITGDGTTWSDHDAVGTGVANASTPAVTALVDSFGIFDLWVVGTDRGIYTSHGSPTTSWTPWPRTPNAAARADSTITALPRVNNGAFTLFVVGTDNNVYSTVSNGPNDFTLVPNLTGGVNAGTSVTVVRITPTLFYLFTANATGEVFANWGPK